MLGVVLLLALGVAAAVWGHALMRANAERRDRDLFDALAERQAHRRSEAQLPRTPAAKRPRRRTAA